MRPNPIVLICASFLAFLPGNATAAVSLVVDSQLAAPSNHGLTQLNAALESRKIQTDVQKSLAQAGGSRLIVIGRATGSEAIRQFQQTAGVKLPTGPEAL